VSEQSVGTWLSDFERGYNYVRLRCWSLVDSSSVQELMELAIVFAEVKGENAELSRGMAACYRDMAQQGRLKEKKKREC